MERTVIKTERQYGATRRQLQLLEQALTAQETEAAAEDVHPVLVAASRRALEEQARDLREELSEYEGLKDGSLPVPDLSSLAELSKNLIRTRIAMGLTQRDLAEKLQVHEQQIQRYEATDYAGASLNRLREVAQALVDLGRR